MRQIQSVIALCGLVFSLSATASDVSAQDSYDLGKINQTIQAFIQPILTDYPLVKDLNFKLDAASVSDNALGGAISFSLKTEKSSWGNTPTVFHLGSSLDMKLVEPAIGNKKGLSESVLKLTLGLDTDTLAMFNHLGDMLYSPDDCAPKAPERPESCDWYKGMKDAKTIADLGTVFNEVKSGLIKSNDASIRELQNKLKTLPENSPEWVDTKKQIENFETFGKVLAAITIVNKNGALTVTVRDLWWDASKKSGLKELSVSVAAAGITIGGDLRMTGDAANFTSTKSMAQTYLKALEKADEKTLKDVKETVTQYVTMALQIIVGG